MLFDVKKAIAAIQGDPDALMDAFEWTDDPVNAEVWAYEYDRMVSGENMSYDAAIILMSMILQRVTVDAAKEFFRFSGSANRA